MVINDIKALFNSLIFALIFLPTFTFVKIFWKLWCKSLHKHLPDAILFVTLHKVIMSNVAQEIVQFSTHNKENISAQFLYLDLTWN